MSKVFQGIRKQTAQFRQGHAILMYCCKRKAGKPFYRVRIDHQILLKIYQQVKNSQQITLTLYICH